MTDRAEPGLTRDEAIVGLLQIAEAWAHDDEPRERNVAALRAALAAIPTAPLPDEELAWQEPDGSAAKEGPHPHYAIWDHEGRKWDILPDDPYAALRAERAARARVEEAIDSSALQDAIYENMVANWPHILGDVAPPEHVEQAKNGARRSALDSANAVRAYVLAVVKGQA